MAPFQPSQEYIDALYRTFVKIAIGTSICFMAVCVLAWWMYRKGQASIVIQHAEDICKESARVNGQNDDVD